MKRIGRNRFIRNCLIAAGNSGSAEFADICFALMDDEAAEVRGMAVWALSRLLPTETFKTLRETRLNIEEDADVRQEWN